MTHGTSYGGAFAITVDVSGNVYVAGNTSSATTGATIATYWKNGVATNLTDGSTNAGANAITVDNSGNVYVAGPTASPTKMPAT